MQVPRQPTNSIEPPLPRLGFTRPPTAGRITAAARTLNGLGNSALILRCQHDKPDFFYRNSDVKELPYYQHASDQLSRLLDGPPLQLFNRQRNGVTYKLRFRPVTSSTKEINITERINHWMGEATEEVETYTLSSLRRERAQGGDKSHRSQVHLSPLRSESRIPQVEHEATQTSLGHHCAEVAVGTSDQPAFTAAAKPTDPVVLWQITSYKGRTKSSRKRGHRRRHGSRRSARRGAARSTTAAGEAPEQPRTLVITEREVTAFNEMLMNPATADTTELSHEFTHLSLRGGPRATPAVTRDTTMKSEAPVKDSVRNTNKKLAVLMNASSDKHLKKGKMVKAEKMKPIAPTDSEESSSSSEDDAEMARHVTRVLQRPSVRPPERSRKLLHPGVKLSAEEVAVEREVTREKLKHQAAEVKDVMANVAASRIGARGYDPNERINTEQLAKMASLSEEEAGLLNSTRDAGLISDKLAAKYYETLYDSSDEDV